MSYGVPPPPPPPKSRNPLTLWLIVAGVVIVLLLIAVGAKNKQATTTPPASATPTASGCSPQPCAGHNGYVLHVTVVETSLHSGPWTKPEPGNHYVALSVSLINNSKDKQSVSPYSFKLKDSQGVTHPADIIIDSPSCHAWQSVDLAPGAQLGPKSACFQASGSATAALTLIWQPDVFTSAIEIPIAPS